MISMGKLNCLSTMDYVWNAVDPLGHLLVLPCPVIKVNGKLQQANPSRKTRDSDLSGMKVWVTPPGKEPRPAEMFPEGGGNTEWALEEGIVINTI